jgi:hypothetical protein
MPPRIPAVFFIGLQAGHVRYRDIIARCFPTSANRLNLASSTWSMNSRTLWQ